MNQKRISAATFPIQVHTAHTIYCSAGLCRLLDSLVIFYFFLSNSIPFHFDVFLFSVLCGVLPTWLRVDGCQFVRKWSLCVPLKHKRWDHFKEALFQIVIKKSNNKATETSFFFHQHEPIIIKSIVIALFFHSVRCWAAFYLLCMWK